MPFHQGRTRGGEASCLHSPFCALCRASGRMAPRGNSLIPAAGFDSRGRFRRFGGDREPGRHSDDVLCTRRGSGTQGAVCRPWAFWDGTGPEASHFGTVRAGSTPAGGLWRRYLNRLERGFLKPDMPVRLRPPPLPSARGRLRRTPGIVTPFFSGWESPHRAGGFFVHQRGSSPPRKGVFS